jgi:hypothetical protein
VLTFPVPAALNGEALTAELAAAGITASVTVSGDSLQVVTDADHSAVERVVKAHVPPPPPASPDSDLAARIQAVHDDSQVSASVKKLTAALLGLNGESAVAGRPTER